MTQLRTRLTQAGRQSSEDGTHSRNSTRIYQFNITSYISLLLALTVGLDLLLAVQASVDFSSKHLIGVHPDRKHLYDLQPGQSFKCIDGSASVPFESINDDYCDCNDASDEPGTSACIHGQFFCQNEGYLQRLIPSAWVNDGLCDCCDASDENKSTARCENTCGALGELYRQEQARYQEIADQGSAIRSQYKEQAKLRREQNSQLLDQYKRELNEKETAVKRLEEEMSSDFGPSSVFFPLKGKCFSFNDREYTYTLCPFERATQESTTGAQTELGRWSGWAGPSDNLYSRQRYEGGIQCWNGPARSVTVNIACGVEDKITMVTEPSKCEYVYDFITPAACPDTDPPEQSNPEGAETSTDNPEPHLETPPGSEDENEHANLDEHLEREDGHDEL